VSLPIPSSLQPSAGQRNAFTAPPNLPAAKGVTPKERPGGRKAQQLLHALEKILQDRQAAAEIVRHKAAFKDLPLQHLVPEPTPVWCSAATRKGMIIWLLSFAPPAAAEKYSLLQAPIKRTAKLLSASDLEAYVQFEFLQLTKRWNAADKFAPFGGVHRTVCSIADPAVQQALTRCSAAVGLWAVRTQALAVQLAQDAVASALCRSAPPSVHCESAIGGADPCAGGASSGVSFLEQQGEHRRRRARMQPDGSLLVGDLTFPPAFAVAGRPPAPWPGTMGSLDYPGAETGPASGTLLACLASFTQPEALNAKLGNAYRCMHCGQKEAKRNLTAAGTPASKKAAAVLANEGALRPAFKRICFSAAPAVLTLHLNRFKQTSSGRFVKNGAHVQFPKKLNMDPFFATARSASDLGPFLYELSGIVVHGGGMGGGHYVAYTRTSNGWGYASDASTSAASDAKALAQQAYILFYVRVNPFAQTAAAAV
jgi:hypothetical protein